MAKPTLRQLQIMLAFAQAHDWCLDAHIDEDKGRLLVTAPGPVGLVHDQTHAFVAGTFPTELHVFTDMQELRDWARY